MPRSSETRERQERSPTRPFQISEQKPRPNRCWMPGTLQWESDPPEPHPPTGQSWCEASKKRSRGHGIKPTCQHGGSRAGTGAVPCAIQSCWVAAPTSRGAGGYSVELRSLHPDGKIHSNVLTTVRTLTTQGALWWIRIAKPTSRSLHAWKGSGLSDSSKFLASTSKRNPCAMPAAKSYIQIWRRQI